MLRVAVTGVNGRMGKTLVQAIVEAQDVELAAGSVIGGDPDFDRDIGLIAGLEPLAIKAVDDLRPVAGEFDVLIDFSSPEGSLKHLDICAGAGKKLVLGTTGFSDSEKEAINKAAEKIAIVFAPNMSAGVNLCFKLVEDAARVLGQDSDVEIIEAHHRLKKDAPSGTALRMGEIVAGVLDRKLSDVAVYGREGLIGERDPGTIGFETIRAGDIVGDHTVMFASAGERVEITHRSNSRMTYAMGALRAAFWLRGKERGLFDMQDVLGLK